jgi:hypothetical protein
MAPRTKIYSGKYTCSGVVRRVSANVFKSEKEKQGKKKRKRKKEQEELK